MIKSTIFLCLVFSFVLAFHFLWVKSAHAHPTSFEGGFAIMSEMSRQVQETSAIYSPKYWLGTGVVLVRVPEKFHLITSQIGWLVKRWNFSHAQWNVYFLGGVGYGFLKQNTESKINGGIYRFGVQLDYETRRIYTFTRYIEHRFFKEKGYIDDQFSAAVGFAPYLGEFDELNSWVIFKFIANNRFSERVYIFMLRFFYKNFLWEIGQDFDGSPQFNFMVRF